MFNKTLRTAGLMVFCIIFFVDKAFGSDVLKNVSDGTTALHSIVVGPLGAIALVGGTIIGIFKAFQGGSVLGALAILMIGILTSWHINSIKALFAQ